MRKLDEITKAQLFLILSMKVDDYMKIHFPYISKRSFYLFFSRSTIFINKIFVIPFHLQFLSTLTILCR